MKFNVGKTDTILVYSGSSRIQPKDVSIEVGEESIKPSSFFRNLGFTLDSDLTLKYHIKGICKRAQFHIQRISRIRRYLDQESTTRLMSAFVLSLLDNGNSILFGLPDKLLKRLQSIEHAAARVVSGRRKFDHISDVLRSLHWLPIRFRIEFKIATLVFRCVSRDSPSYLRELVKPYFPLLTIFVPTRTHLTWLCNGRARRNVVKGLFHELPHLSGMSYLSSFDHLPPF